MSSWFYRLSLSSHPPASIQDSTMFSKVVFVLFLFLTSTTLAVPSRKMNLSSRELEWEGSKYGICMRTCQFKVGITLLKNHNSSTEREVKLQATESTSSSSKVLRDIFKSSKIGGSFSSVEIEPYVPNGFSTTGCIPTCNTALSLHCICLQWYCFPDSYLCICQNWSC